MRWSTVIALAVVAGIVIWRAKPDPKPIAEAAEQKAPESKDTPAQFRCDGKTHCSEMTSCEEATFYLRNCPDVKLDGDDDGVPCERQFCGR